MKKNSINFLCVCIIAVIFASTVVPTVAVVVPYLTALGSSETSPDDEMNDLTPVEVSFSPEMNELYTPSNTLTFNGNEELPVVMYNGIVMMPAERVVSSIVADLIICLATFVLLVLVIVEFIRLIININKGLIFENHNIRYIIRMGVYLLSIGVLDCISGMLRAANFDEIGLKMDGYELSSQWGIPWGTFLLGLIALLLGRIWVIAKHMKEEQQLTI